ncbi:MAG: C_GCAxxG_C_C family protein [Deltaproteobacteria bacterium]|nr:C_GCAxxG_C_C family protein [Deltaproteobacteria bacterium]MBW1920904.1 C_GCAxxG_C_C family protein [Deltaproteobacteria bacterium]MBW1931489.1 C_GCAxxG_C_C family protein [Deltaproteobacteria bacterium]MBW1976721.1 C_GCAxxG_C_C family protein [Deltaproteobacteria bacterium]MBW2044828.1 C_GCAxxG_C_C family protein [Deltaproteobacteria bacterium]
MGEMREELLEKAYKLGFEYEKIYKGCCQSTIAAVQDTLNIREDSVFKAGTGWAAGGGLTGIGICGGCMGGSMVLSQLLGRVRSNFEDPERVRFKSYELTKKLIDAFIDEFGTINCWNIHYIKFGRPYYINDLEEFNKFEEAGGHVDKCTDVVGKASQIAVNLILDERLVETPKD